MYFDDRGLKLRYSIRLSDFKMFVDNEHRKLTNMFPPSSSHSTPLVFTRHTCHNHEEQIVVIVILDKGILRHVIIRVKYQFAWTHAEGAPCCPSFEAGCIARGRLGVKFRCQVHQRCDNNLPEKRCFRGMEFEKSILESDRFLQMSRIIHTPDAPK